MPRTHLSPMEPPVMSSSNKPPLDFLLFGSGSSSRRPPAPPFPSYSQMPSSSMMPLPNANPWSQNHPYSSSYSYPQSYPSPFVSPQSMCLSQQGGLDGMSYDRKDGSLFRCNEIGCGHAYKTQERLIRHKMKSHGTKPRLFVCNMCGRSFAEKGNLKKHHKSVHDGERNKLCPYPGCGKRFSFNDGLSRHIKNVHEQLRPHVCPCGKSFKQLSHLKKHRKARICSGAI